MSRTRYALAIAALTSAALGAAAVPASAATAAGDHLVVTVSPDGSEGESVTYQLDCHPAGGDHPAPKKACQAIDAAEDPFAPVPPDMVCTMIYGGPETATITGTWQGETVDAEYSRVNGCEIHRWDQLAPVFGA